MFNRLDQEIALCKQHLRTSNSGGTLIEAIVVGYILSVYYAAAESMVIESIYERCRVGMDAQSENFLNHTVKRVVNSIKVHELSGLLGMFCNTYKQDFQREIPDNSRAMTCHNSLLSNRHALAHHASVNATMKDIDEWVPLAKSVIAAFRNAMGLGTGQGM